MKFYELTENYNNIWELVGDEEIDLEALEVALQAVETEISVKAENIAKMIKGIQAEAEMIKAEEQRLTNRRRAMENKAEYMKVYMEGQLLTAGLEKVKTPLFTIAMQNNPASVEVVDESLIPDEFAVYERKIVKKDILARLKAGEEVPGAVIKQEKSLRIR